MNQKFLVLSGSLGTLQRDFFLSLKEKKQKFSMLSPFHLIKNGNNFYGHMVKLIILQIWSQMFSQILMQASPLLLIWFTLLLDLYQEQGEYYVYLKKYSSDISILQDCDLHLCNWLWCIFKGIWMIKF